MKVFLDTNVLVSAFTARGFCADLLRYLLAEHEVLTGEVNLTELRRVLLERFDATAEQLASVESLLRDQTVIPKPRRPRPSVFAIAMTSGFSLRRSVERPSCW